MHALCPSLAISCSLLAKPIRWIGRSAAALLVVACCVAPARAQLTVEAITGGAVDKGPHEADIKDAIKAFGGLDFDGARAALTKAKDKTAKLPPVETMLASMFLTANERNAARTELEKATRSYDTDPEAYLRLAELDLIEGRTTSARLLYLKAGELVKDFSESPKRKDKMRLDFYKGLAFIEEGLEKWKIAEALLKNWIKIEPDLGLVHQRLGRVLFKQDRADDALAEYQTAAQKDERIPPPEISMFMNYHEARDAKAAGEWLTKATKLKTDRASAELAVSQALYLAGRNDEAEAHADKALELEAENAEALLLRGMIARIKNDDQGAIAYLERAHAVSPGNGSAINHLAQVLIEQSTDDSRRRAIEFAEMNYRANQQNLEAIGTLGWVYYRSGRVIEADNMLRKLMQTGRLTAETAYFLAYIYHDSKRDDAALKFVDTARDAAKNRPFPYQDEVEKLFKEVTSRGPARSAGGADEPGGDAVPRKPAASGGSGGKRPASGGNRKPPAE